MAYRTQSEDTSEAAERAQTEILRRLGPRGRAKMASRLTARNWAGMQRALRRAHPDWSEQQLRVEWVALAIRRRFGVQICGCAGEIWCLLKRRLFKKSRRFSKN